MISNIVILLFLESPLTLSCTLSPEKCRSMIITLVSGGAHMDFRNRHGFTPIHKSALTSNSEAIKVSVIFT